MKFEELFNIRNKKKSFREKLEDWWSYTKTYRFEIPFNQFKNGVSNVIKWFNIVWNDADYDHRYITTVLRFKINNTADYIEKKQRHLNWEQDVKYMRIACRLIDKIWGDSNGYDSEYLNYSESDYNWKIPIDIGLADKAKNLVTSVNRDRMIDDILYDKEFVPLDFEETEKELEDELMADYDGDLEMEVNQVSENFDEYFSKNKLMHRKAIEYLKNINTLWTNPGSKQTQAMVISNLKHAKAKRIFFKILEYKMDSWWD